MTWQREIFSYYGLRRDNQPHRQSTLISSQKSRNKFLLLRKLTASPGILSSLAIQTFVMKFSLHQYCLSSFKLFESPPPHSKTSKVRLNYFLPLSSRSSHSALRKIFLLTLNSFK